MFKKKKCQIYASLPITCFEVPIIGETELNLTEDEIYKCLCAKAEVLEILSNGKRINLDFTNYNKDNEPNIIIKTSNNKEEITEKIIETKEEIITETSEVLEEVEEEITEDSKEIIIESSEVLEEVEEEIVESEIKIEQPVAETVKSYQVASRNNYNNKKKNKK